MRTSFVVLAAVAVAIAAVPVQAKQETSEETDPSAEVRRETEWFDVAPAPVPRGLPVLRSAGRGRQVVDRAALRSLLVNRKYARLTEVLEAFQAQFEANPRREDALFDALDGLGQPHSREREMLDAWAAASPRSFAPYLVRASHWYRTAFLWRGGGWARDTSRFEFRAMGDALANARRDAERALAIRPGLVEALRLLIPIGIGEGRRDLARRAMERAIARCPSCYQVRAEWIWWLQPNWGGSLEEMERFARAGADPRSPRHRNLRAYVDLERAQEARRQGRYEEALAHLDRACATAREWTFFVQRADVRGALRDGAGYRADVERAYALHPGTTEVVSRRAWNLASDRRWEEAGQALLYVLRSNPTSYLGGQMHAGMVRSLGMAARREHEAGRCAGAERVASLAAQLAPRDPEVAATAAEVRCAPGRRRPAGAPVSGDIRPVLRVSVEDRAGKPVGGAAIRIGHGAVGWRWLAEEAEAEDARTSEDGSAWVPADDVGPRAVLAVVQSEPLRAVAAACEVTQKGASVRLVAGGTVRIEGKVVDGAFRPVAGVVVTAVPDVDRLGSEPRALGSARSLADGSFTVEGVDSGRYRLIARGPSYASISQEQVGGGESGIVVRVRKNRVLRGRVLVERPGGPAPPESFVVRGAFGERTFSSADGSFVIPLEYPAPAEGHVGFSVQGYPETIRVLDVAQEATDAGDVLVGPGRIIRGLVLDSRGYALAGAAVRPAGGWESVKTDASGQFEVEVARGPATLRIRHDRHLPAVKEVAAEEDRVAVRLSAGLEMKILALDEEGALVSGVTFVAHSGTKTSVCTTAPTGRCELAGLEEGEYWLKPNPDPRNPARVVGPAMYVRVAPEGGRALRYRWPKGRSRLEVKVLDEHGQETDGVALVFEGSVVHREAMDDRSEARLPHYVAPPLRALENLPAGRYTVFARGPWGLPCARATVDVRTGENLALTMRLGDGTCP